jgi:replicative DNA helicase
MNPLNYSLELEQRVLETLMHFGNHSEPRVQKALLKLTSDCFYNLHNAELFTMIRAAFQKEEPFDFVDTLVQIPRDRTELHSHLEWIISNYRQYHASEANFEYDVERIITLKNLRKQLGLIQTAVAEVQECPNPDEAQSILMKAINDIATLGHKESKCGMINADIADDYYEGNLAQDMIIPTTCEALNACLDGGIRSKSLITVAAGAGVGKTGFAIFLMDAIARNQPDSQCLFFSLEMEARHIWMRHVGIMGGKQFDNLNDDEKMRGVTKSIQVPVTIYDPSFVRSCSDIDFIITTARLKSMDKPISVIVVDYLGLVENKGKFERNDLKQADVTSKLARIALELNCTVIALSQINRGNAQRSKDDQCPWPQDAADSSGSHRSSTLWLGVDRPELYQDDFCYKNQFVIKCRKNRFGGTFELILAFNDGTFAEVPHGWFKKPEIKTKSVEQAVFSSRREDFYKD